MKITKKSRIAVICGGISSEREISIRSGKNCFNALKRLRYTKTRLVDVKSVKNLVRLKGKIDAAFLTTHGKFGEDGALQGVLEWLKIPYTGSSVLASAISMDKWLTKQIAKNNEILTPKAYLINYSNIQKLNLQKIWKELSKKDKAVFLKPNDDGSSVNTFKIKTFNDLKKKIKRINLKKSDFLIEEFISGREITVSIIEVNNKLKALPILELKPKGEFYDYHSKYTKGMTEFILPAKLSKKIKKKTEDDSTKIFSLIGCSSFGRIDYILDINLNPYLLEINSLPGMTDTSDLPAQAEAKGINYYELVEIILMCTRL